MTAPLAPGWHARGLCCCLSCRRAVLAGPDRWSWSDLYDPTFSERQALWLVDPALTFAPRRENGRLGGHHLCFWK